MTYLYWTYVIYPAMYRSGYLWFGLDSAPASDHKRGPDPEMPLRNPELQFPSISSKPPSTLLWEVESHRGQRFRVCFADY